MKKFLNDWSPFIAFILLAICLMLLKRGCEPKPVTPIQVDTHRQDSFRTIIKYHDSTRVHYINKWRTRVKDSTKCYTEIVSIIAECDTIIRIDSILIGSLKGLVHTDSIIQVKLINVIDSVCEVNNNLNKKVKRNRTFAKIAFVTGLGLGGAVGVKLR